MPVVQDPVLREAGIKAGIMIWRVEVCFVQKTPPIMFK